MERNDLPDRWVTKKISAICEKPQYGYTESACHEAVGPKLLRITDIQNGKVDWDKVPYCKCEDVDKYRLRTGDIVFARTGATTGKSFIITNPPAAVFASYLIRLRVGPSILSEFLYWYFKSSTYWAAVSSGIDVGNRPNMNGTKLANIEVSFPEDKAEQRRIVKRIEELTRRIQEAQKLMREAMQDISSLNPSLLDHLFQMSEARNWRKVELGEISTIIMGQSPKGSSYNLNGLGAPLLNGPTEFGPEHPTPVQWTTEPTRLCEEGDILFCVRGSTTGRMNWADQQYCLGRGLAAIRPHQDKCLPGFVYAFVQTQSAAILHQGEGGVFPNFNRDQLTSMEIPLPPIDEQRHVAEYLNKCQTKALELGQLQTETEAELAAFTPALLAKAFRGEL